MMEDLKISTLFIPQSQSHKYQVQNIQLYEKGRLCNLGILEMEENAEILEMEAVMERLLPEQENIYRSKISLTHSTAAYIVRTLQTLLQNIEEDEEVFVGNIVLNTPNVGHKNNGEEIVGEIIDCEEPTTLEMFYQSFQPSLETWTSLEISEGYKIKEKDYIYLEDAFIDRDAVIRMDVYMPLPYRDEMLSTELLESFQNKWGIERPWRYTVVRNWILVPKIDLYGTETYTLRDIAEYARDLRHSIYTLLTSKLEPNDEMELRSEASLDRYKALRNVYAYLLFVQRFYNTYPSSSTIHDQIQFHIARQYDLMEVEGLLETLQTFFQESFMEIVYGLLCDLNVLEEVQHAHPRLDDSFVAQATETIHHLLREHQLGCDPDDARAYINEQVDTLLTTTYPLLFLYNLNPIESSSLQNELPPIPS